MFEPERLREDLQKVGHGVQQFWDDGVLRVWNRAAQAAVFLSLVFTVLIRIPVIRSIIGLLGPAALPRANQYIWDAWQITGVIALPLLLWATRRVWWPLSLLGISWVLRLLGRGFVALWRRITGSRATVQDGEAPPVAPRPLITTAPVRTDQRPPLDLLGPPAKIETRPCPEVAQALVKALTSLGFAGCRVVRHYAGPVVAVAEVRPPENVKASAIQRLASDVSAQLGTQNVTIEPLVGSAGVLEFCMQSSDRITVPLRALLDSPEYRQVTALPMVVATDSKGRPVVVDLVDLPHLLVAGASGSGKSVCLSQLLLGLIVKLGPDELRLLLVDPKKVELALYKHLPHLLRPIVTSPEEALGAMEQLVIEMERRYQVMEAAGKRNISDFNRAYPQNRLPFIVGVVDELADLMQATKGEGGSNPLEQKIVRLGQKARAAGIHLILATQSPRKEVITGLIKANIAARVALTVSDMVESRIILDYAGAETLRGKGDLIFRQGQSQIRGQAAWVPDDMINAVVGWWQHPSRSTPAAAPDAQQEQSPSQMSRGDALADEPLSREEQELATVAEMVLQRGQVGRRDVQEALRIGNQRASEILQRVEEQGWLKSASGPKPRQCALSDAERRKILAAVRGVHPNQIVLDDDGQGGDGDNEEEPDPGPATSSAHRCRQCRTLTRPSGSTLYGCDQCEVEFTRSEASDKNRCPSCGRYAFPRCSGSPAPTTARLLIGRTSRRFPAHTPLPPAAADEPRD